MHCIQKIHNEDKIKRDLGLQLDHLSQNRVRESLFKGLEQVDCHSLRGEIWKLLCKVQNSKSQYKRGIMEKFIEEENDMIVFKIKKDLTRTFPGTKEFAIPFDSGNNRLFNVLKAYSAYDSETSYCQGMNFIAAMLLVHIQDQEDAFWCLVFVMFARDWRSIFVDNAKKIEYLIADLGNHLRRKNK